jgi:hypothetical protein
MNQIVAINPAEPVMLGFLERAMIDPAFDVAKFEIVLRAMQEERAKQAERLFYAAMADAQAEMEPVRRDSTNAHTRSKYARFEAIDAMLRPIYTKHGFSVGYRTGAPAQPGAVRVICKVAHNAGHSVEAELEAGLDSAGSGGKTNKTDVQAVGSTTSYLKRYLCTLVWNVALADDDDDGEGSRRPSGPLREEALRQRQNGNGRRESMDETLRGDEIPDHDRPPEPDKAQEVATQLEARIKAATTEEALHAITGEAKVGAQIAWLARNRPELHTLVNGAMSQRYADLVAARQELEGLQAEAEEDAAEPDMALP